jgi:hypothetical protein
MILHYVKQWEERKHLLEQWLNENEPNSYENIYEMLFHLVVTKPQKTHSQLTNFNEWNWNRFVKIDDGSYQGNEIYILCSNVYQPSLTDYIFTQVAYGSCSGCDTFLAIQESEDKAERVKGYMTLALHMVQETKSFKTNEK